MESVIPAQRWGVTCGPGATQAATLPAYAQPVPGVTVALKNGWKYLPTCAAQDDSCPWQVNSIGWVKGEGRDYVPRRPDHQGPAGQGHLRPRLRDHHHPGRVPADLGQPRALRTRRRGGWGGAGLPGRFSRLLGRT